MKRLRQKFFAGGGATATISGLILASALIVGFMMSCNKDNSSKPTAPNIPVFPEEQSSENSNEMGFYATRGVSDVFETTEIGDGFFRVNVPIAGGYVLTYTTTLGTFHIVFEATDKALLTIGLLKGDKVESASIQQAKLKVPAQYMQYYSGPVNVYYKPDDGTSLNWESFIEVFLDLLIELIKNGQPTHPVPTPAPSPSIPTKTHECPLLQKAGGNTDEVHIVEMHQPAGTFEFSYETFTAEDSIVVEYEGKPLFQTGCVGANGTKTLEFEGKSTSITVRVDADCGGGEPNTEWNFTVNCPKQCNFKNEAGKEKCFGASGNQCEGGDPLHAARYNENSCMVQMFVTPGSQAHDSCCVDNPNGRACQGWNLGAQFAPRDTPCYDAWDQAYADSMNGNGTWQTFGPYYQE